jgi:hypothetical protein
VALQHARFNWEGKSVSFTIAENLGVLKAHVKALEARLEAQMGLVTMCRVQIEGPHDNAQWGYMPC